MNAVGGRGFGGGGGRGRGGWGRRNWFHATGLTGWQRAAAGWPAYGMPPAQMPAFVPPPSAPVAEGQELDALRAQAEYLQGVLENVRKRIEQLQSQPSEAST